MKIFLVLLLSALLFFTTASGHCYALSFDWPSGVGILQKIQTLKQEILSMRILAKSAQSKKPISAASYLAIDLATGKTLLQKNSAKSYPIASITKLMNAVIVRETGDSDKTLTLTKKMLSSEGASPSIFSGLTIKISDLLQASLIQSTNDAAESLAYPLGKKKFLEVMNQKAKDLGMSKSVFVDATGLSKKDVSTASDLAKLLSYIYKNHPEILEITKNNNFWLPDQKGTLLKFKNLNDFYNHPGFVGGKTGYSPEAKQTFAAIFDISKKPVAIVILRSSDYQSDTFKILSQLKN